MSPIIRQPKPLNPKPLRPYTQARYSKPDKSLNLKLQTLNPNPAGGCRPELLLARRPADPGIGGAVNTAAGQES